MGLLKKRHAVFLKSTPLPPTLRLVRIPPLCEQGAWVSRFYNGREAAQALCIPTKRTRLTSA